MPQILNIRLQGIGHPNARMESLIIPFAEKNGMPGSTILWLRNGGGKGALISLMLWLMNPEGKLPSHLKIEDYVFENDCAFLVIEWQLDHVGGSPEEPQRYLTGACCELRPGSTRAKKDLRCLFFASKVLPEEPQLTLEGLPLTLSIQGQTHQRLLGNFRRTWLNLGVTYPHAELVFTEVQHEWRRILEHVGIDPLLFHYQLTMNMHEAGVGDLFTFAKQEDFLRFFLDLTADASIGNKVSDLIGQCQEVLKKEKDQLVPELQFLEGCVKKLLLLGPCANERKTHLTHILQLEQTRASFSHDIKAARQQLLDAHLHTQAQQEAFAQRVESLKKEGKAAKGSAAFSRLQGYRLQGKHLQEQRRDLLQRQKASRFAERCWEMAGPLYQARLAQKKRLSLEQALRIWEQEQQQPLRMLAEKTGQHLKAALC